MFLEALNRNRAKRGATASVVKLPAEASSAAPPPPTTLTQSRSGGSSSGGGCAQRTGRLQSRQDNVSSGPARTSWRRPRSLLRHFGSAAPMRQHTTIEILPDERRGGRTYRRRHKAIVYRRPVCSPSPVSPLPLRMTFRPFLHGLRFCPRTGWRWSVPRGGRWSLVSGAGVPLVRCRGSSIWPVLCRPRLLSLPTQSYEWSTRACGK
ncbi:unnamed protein product [Ectocarpus sp. 4 AP-2014]